MSARAWVALVLAIVPWPARAVAAERSWLDGAESAHAFADLSRLPATAFVPGKPGAVLLPHEFRFRGARYDTLEWDADPGTMRLTFTDGGTASTPGALLIRPAGPDLVLLPDATLQLRIQDDAVAWRATGLATRSGDRVAFDVLLEPGKEQDDLVVQWLQAPPDEGLARDAIVVADLARPDGRSEPLSEGYAIRKGGVIAWPGDEPWHPPSTPLSGCGIARAWDAIARDNDCYHPLTGTGSDYSQTGLTADKWWHFRENAYCKSCPYTFYVAVECGTEIHLPFRDMEGNQIQITNVFTGVEMDLEALNDCAKAPFPYCDRCATGGGIVPDPTGTVCSTGGTHLDCIPYLQRSTLIQWGWPLTDRDGDGNLDDLPCGPPNTDTCTATTRGSGGYPEHEEQNTDVILRGAPALCGVYRIDVVSGGYDWYLTANCDGVVPLNRADAANDFTIYQNCADALARFDPVPELAITKLDFLGACPDIVLVVEVTNLGCVDAPVSPVHVDFSQGGQPDLDVDLGVVAAGSSVSMRIPVTLRTTPQSVTATIDPLNVVSECTEQAAGSFSGCAPVTGADSLTSTLCTCANTVVPQLADDALVACNGASVTMDASTSSAVPCTGGLLEYQVLTAAGALVRDWDADPLVTLTPSRCPSIDSYVLKARCSLETGTDCIRSVPFTVECSAAPSLNVATNVSPVCQGDPVTITASPGFGSYVWEDGHSGTSFTDRPGATTTYRVTATTPAGCEVQGEVTVDVLPDPMPGPLGASLRVAKRGTDVFFTYAELPGLVGTYELLAHVPDGATSPCANAEPSVKPAPIVMQAAASIDSALPGDPAPQLVHLGGVDACPRLIFYKVVGTSPCRFRRGPACNGFPMQRLPCP